jgi:hypothetical protein
MRNETIDNVKANVFKQVSALILSMDAPGLNPVEKTEHILDLIEQLLARAIAGSCLTEQNIDEMSEQSIKNIRKMAKVFLREEKS